MIPFAGNPLNRASEKRTDSDWIESKRHDPSSLVLPMRRLEPFLLEPEKSDTTELGLLRPEIADSLAGPEATCIFLGLDGDRAVFAVDVPEAASPANPGAFPNHKTSAIRPPTATCGGITLPFVSPVR